MEKDFYIFTTTYIICIDQNNISLTYKAWLLSFIRSFAIHQKVWLCSQKTLLENVGMRMAMLWYAASFT